MNPLRGLSFFRLLTPLEGKANKYETPKNKGTTSQGRSNTLSFLAQINGIMHNLRATNNRMGT